MIEIRLIPENEFDIKEFHKVVLNNYVTYTYPISKSLLYLYMFH